MGGREGGREIQKGRKERQGRDERNAEIVGRREDRRERDQGREKFREARDQRGREGRSRGRIKRIKRNGRVHVLWEGKKMTTILAALTIPVLVCRLASAVSFRNLKCRKAREDGSTLSLCSTVQVRFSVSTLHHRRLYQPGVSSRYRGKRIPLSYACMNITLQGSGPDIHSLEIG